MNAEPGSNLQSATTRRTTLEVEEGREDHSHPTTLHPDSPTSFLSTHGVEPELETNRPLLLVKLTGYRLLTTAIIVSFGTVKAMASLKGEAVTATTLDWVMGVVLGTILYWLGLYENLQPPVATWFFHEDYTLDLLYLPYTGIVTAIFGSGIALFLCLYMFIPISAYMLITTKLFSEKEWSSIILGHLVFMVVWPLLMIAASCIVLSLKFILLSIGPLVLKLGGRRFKARLWMMMEGYFDRCGRHPLIYSLLILGADLYMISALFPLIVYRAFPRVYPGK